MGSLLIKCLLSAVVTYAATIQVDVGKSGLEFSPQIVTANIGDVISFHFWGTAGPHSVTSGTYEAPCTPSTTAFFSGLLDGSQDGSEVFEVEITSTDPIWYYCSAKRHCQLGMVGVINPPADKSISGYAAAAMNVVSASAPPSPTGGLAPSSTSPPSSADITSQSSSLGSDLGSATGSGSSNAITSAGSRTSSINSVVTSTSSEESGALSGTSSRASHTTSAASTPKETSNPTNTPPSTVSLGGLSSGAKIGIGVGVSLAALLLLGIGIFWYIRRRKQQRKTIASIQEPEKDDGGLPENVTSLSELPKHTSQTHSVSELNAHQASVARFAEIQGTARHEIDASQPLKQDVKAEIQGTPRHEMDDSLPPRQEIDANMTQRYEMGSSPKIPPAVIARKPVSPDPAKAYPVTPAPWEDHGYDMYHNPANEPLTAEDLELQRMEEEMAQVKLRKERLKNREEELTRSIAERKREGGPSGS